MYMYVNDEAYDMRVECVNASIHNEFVMLKRLIEFVTLTRLIEFVI